MWNRCITPSGPFTTREADSFDELLSELEPLHAIVLNGHWAARDFIGRIVISPAPVSASTFYAWDVSGRECGLTFGEALEAVGASPSLLVGTLEVELR